MWRNGAVRRARLLALGAVAAICLLTGVHAAPARAVEAGVDLPGPEVGQVPRISPLGTHWVRMFLTWPDIEPARGVYAPNWIASYEEAFRGFPAGTKFLLDVVDSPQWETGSPNPKTAPADPADYAAMLAMLARRFGSRVSAYEIWNEEDAPAWWVGAPEPAGYAALLRAAYPAVKAAAPNATVVMGGLTGNDYSYLEGVYAAGGKGYFDAVGVHTDTACNVLSPYEFLRDTNNRMIPDSFLAYREIHNVMLANGDDKPIWMTELSWRTTSAVCSEGAWAGQKAAGVSEEQQATFLTQAYHCMSEDPYVQVALWFPLQDLGTVTSGLIRANGSHKPSYAALRTFAHEGDTLHEPCGTFTGPKIAIGSPSDHITYSGPLPIHVWATSKVGVFRITLKIDGRLIRNYDGKTYPSTLSGAITWQGAKHISFGRHTLTFLAYDRERNVSEKSITIVHAPPRHGHGSSGGLSGYGSSPAAPHGKRRTKHHAKRHARRRRRHHH
jgi:hypothetical protein